MENNLIYDIGMNNGDDAAYYLTLGYKVIAVDASPVLVKEAQIRFRHYIEENKIEVLNLGIAEKEGFVDFYLNKYRSEWNSFDLMLGSRGGAGYETTKVKTKSLDQL